MTITSLCSLPYPVAHFAYHNRLVTNPSGHRPLNVFPQRNIRFSQLKAPESQQHCVHSLESSSFDNNQWFKLPKPLIELSASSLLLITLGFFTLSSFAKPPAALAVVDSSGCRPMVDERTEGEDSVLGSRDVENIVDAKLREEFENWKSKTYALTAPLRVVALQGSVPPAWIKDFIQSQGRRSKLSVQFRLTLEGIYSELLRPSVKVDASSKSATTADLITVGDSWLDLAIGNAIIEPIENAEGQDWFKDLTEKWKVYLRRNSKGKIDPDGRIWSVPYRWGSMVIAYKKSKFDKLNLAPVEDWADLWRPELAGRIAMVDSPREVVGAVLKYMGASYNTNDIKKEVPGGISAVKQNLALLAKQVLLFDSTTYLKAFNVGDAWVAVGWSSDILPAAKRMSDVAVVVPKSGASLWADLWAIPAPTRFPQTDKVRGRIRGPSPLIHQWIEFCLQPARELPFKLGVFPGASPYSLEGFPLKVNKELPRGAPKLITNLVAGIPPPEILAKCEFLEPLSESAMSDYRLLISTMERPDRRSIQQILSALFLGAWMKPLFLKRWN